MKYLIIVLTFILCSCATTTANKNQELNRIAKEYISENSYMLNDVCDIELYNRLSETVMFGLNNGLYVWQNCDVKVNEKDKELWARYWALNILMDYHIELLWNSCSVLSTKEQFDFWIITTLHAAINHGDSFTDKFDFCKQFKK